MRSIGSLVEGNQTNSLLPTSGIPTFSASCIRARVAQLDRASASGAEGCGFDPRPAHHFFFGFFPAVSFPSGGIERFSNGDAATQRCWFRFGRTGHPVTNGGAVPSDFWCKLFDSKWKSWCFSGVKGASAR